MKKIKKLLLGLVTFAAMAVLCAVCAGAETAGDYEYSVLDDGTVKITGYTGNADILRIPDTISDKSVTVIGNSAFGYKSFTELYIPSSIKSIEQKAFYYCRKLTSVKIPSSVEIIYEYAFQNCSALETVTVSEGVTRICDYAFKDCYNLSSVSLPDSMRRIGQKAFYDTAIVNDQTSSVKYVDKWVVQCDDIYLKNLTISEAVGIADRVFTVAKGSLEKVVIYSGVKYIGELAFAGCNKLKELTLPDGLEYINYGAFMDCKLMSIVLPKGLKSMDGAFEFCTALVSIEIPEGLTEIGERTFYGCRSLKSITIPESVTAIGENAFYNCAVLSSVTLPSKLETIGENAFLYCPALKSITIPKSVTDISLYALGYSDLFKQYSDFKIYCYTGSSGEYYAKRNEFDYELLDHTEHTYGAWTTTKAATCTASGTQTRKCSCGATETKTVSALGHNYVTSVVKPTYTAEGYTLHKCSRCGNSYKDTYTAKLVVPTVSGLKCSSKTNVAVTLRWTKNTVADGYILDRYDSANSKWVTVKKITSNATTSYTVTGLRASTTNKFRIKAYKSTASSKFTYLNVNTRPYTTTGLSVSSKTNVAITLKWNKNISADGYVLDKYDGTKWVTVKKITSNATTSYTVTGLKASTTFKFRLKAYKMYGTAYESSAFSYINVNTRPYTTTGFKISSTTKTTIKMQWNKNISASGYCIEKWDGTKWVQIKRFTSNANVSYTVVSGLKANTSYKFRLRAYKTIGTVNEYSAYTQTLTAKTKA